MQIIKVNIDSLSSVYIKIAAEVLKEGGLIVYPTDTAYGLGANALNEKAIKKVYEVKGRDFSKPTHVVVRNWKMIEKLTETNDLAKKLFDKFLPGPLTIILLKKKIVPDILTAGLNTIGVRIPNNAVTKKLSIELSFPYTTPSANKSGGITPYSIGDVKKELDISKVDLILDAGILLHTRPSTVVDLTKTLPKIIREGPITKSRLMRVFN
jgi:L-threonylcarbamoyladenylate synthase